MKNKNRAVHRLGRPAVIAVSLLVLNGCGVFGSKDVAREEGSPEVVLDMKVKQALIKELDNEAAAIKVESANGAVKLTGFAESEKQKQKAGQVAAKVAGVNQVDNQITVKR